MKENVSSSNNDIYELSLRNEIRQTHARAALDDLIKEQKINTYTSNGEPMNNAGAYYMDYTHYKNKDNKVHFKIM